MVAYNNSIGGKNWTGARLWERRAKVAARCHMGELKEWQGADKSSNTELGGRGGQAMSSRGRGGGTGIDKYPKNPSFNRVE